MTAPALTGLPLGLAGVPADLALAEVSEALVFSAIAAYAVALIAFAIDLAGGGRTATADEPALVAASSASTLSVGAAQAGSTAVGTTTAVGVGAEPGRERPRRAGGVGA